MEVFQGRPADLTGRLEKERESYDLLDRLGIRYQRTDHAPTATMEVCKEIDAVLELMICKNLFLCNRQKTRFYLLLMPADKPFRTKELSAQIGSSRPVLRRGGGYGAAAQRDAWLGQRPGADVRPGAAGPAADRRRRAGGIPLWLPPLYQHLQCKDDN